MNAIDRYNEIRDREQATFDSSELGTKVNLLLNLDHPSYRGPGTPRAPVLLSLAAMIAFAGSMPAFYALRSLRAV